MTYRRTGDEGILAVRASFDDGASSYEHHLAPRPPRRDGRTIPIPAERIVCLSSTHIGFLGELGELDRVVGVSSRQHVAHRKLLERIDRGEVVEVGQGTPLDTERLLSLKPDVVMVFGVNERDIEPFDAVRRAGVPVLIVAEYSEDSPLGRAEWIKVFGLMTGREQEAARRFEEITRTYEALAQQCKEVAHRPTVLLNASFQGIWYMPGGESYMARLLQDAGADYLWKNERGSRVLPLDFETVFARGRQAEYWLNVGFWRTLAEGVQNDPRYRNFESFIQGRVYNHMGSVQPSAGTDFFERGAARPDLLLADLIAIFHPDRLPEHKMVWYEPLPAE